MQLKRHRRLAKRKPQAIAGDARCLHDTQPRELRAARSGIAYCEVQHCPRRLCWVTGIAPQQTAQCGARQFDGFIVGSAAIDGEKMVVVRHITTRRNQRVPIRPQHRIAGFRASRGLSRALAAYVQRRHTFPWRRRLEIAMHIGEPLREKLNLPPDVNYDLLLCALYYRTFITDRVDDAQRPADAQPLIQVR